MVEIFVKQNYIDKQVKLLLKNSPLTYNLMSKQADNVKFKDDVLTGFNLILSEEVETECSEVKWLNRYNQKSACAFFSNNTQTEQLSLTQFGLVKSNIS